MSTSENPSGIGVRFLRDYGMVIVLVFLAALFAALTWKEQHPTGNVAGRQVARSIAASHPSASVLVVARATSEDQAFANAAADNLELEGCQVLGRVNGAPADVRIEIDAILADGKTIDVVAANDVTARWSVYDRYESVGRDKCVTPRPYYWPDFLKVSNLLGVANQTAIYAIIAIGMTMVIITAGIDLGVGSLVALASVTSALVNS